jgi:predicted nucleotidyltransferase
MPSEEQAFSDIAQTLKKTVAALRDAEIPFLLGGSLASWARGGPESRHDLDFMLKEEDVDRALEALREVGMSPERPPENWLVKVWDGDVLVDLIHHPSDLPITDEVIDRGEQLNILSIQVPVMALEDVVATKLLAITEHYIRYETLLQIARALREQIDWDAVWERTHHSAFARAFFVIIEGLGILPQERFPADELSRRRETRVRVVSPG